MTTSLERTGLSPSATPDWIPDNLRLAPGESFAKVSTSSDGGIGISDGSDKRGVITAELAAGVPTGNFS